MGIADEPLSDTSEADPGAFRDLVCIMYLATIKNSKFV
jgi:hypothetical protein